jgi:hypothetical protein
MRLQRCNGSTSVKPRLSLPCFALLVPTSALFVSAREPITACHAIVPPLRDEGGLTDNQRGFSPCNCQKRCPIPFVKSEDQTLFSPAGSPATAARRVLKISRDTECGYRYISLFGRCLRLVSYAVRTLPRLWLRAFRPRSSLPSLSCPIEGVPIVPAV